MIRELVPAQPLPARVVTVDMDGTLFDPWACHGYAGNHRSSDGCTHVRADTLAAVRRVCRAADAKPVVLSWRSGLHQVTADWLVEIGLEVAAIFIPGSTDDLVDGHLGQVGFKRATVEALQRAGVDVVASFDDNREVTAALAAVGVRQVRLVQHRVSLSQEEWAAGRRGKRRANLANVRDLELLDS